MAKRWLCRLGLHRYQKKRDDDGSAYLECRLCEKVKEIAPPIGFGGDWGASF